MNEIRRILSINDVGKNNKILDVVKRGFIFLNENDNDNVNKTKLSISSYNKKNIKKFEENMIETNKEIKIKQKLNYNNYYKGEKYYNLFKNRNYIIKNLNNCLNEYRFYNKIVHNSIEKQKYYEKKVIPGLFNNKFNILSNNQNTCYKNENINKKISLI
jgi:hypothetical protein